MSNEKKSVKEIKQIQEDAYIESLSEKEKVAYDIAVNFLETSFDLERSLGFVDYVKNRYLREDS